MRRRIALLVCMLLWLSPSAALAATAGPTNCGASADVANWTSDSSACGPDDSRATIANATQTDLRLTTFGFAINDGDIIINGITVIVEGNGPESVAGRRNVGTGMTKDGTNLAGTRIEFTALPQTTDSTISFGGVSNLWGTTWTEAEVEATTFGALLRHDGDAYVRNIDNVTITLTYSLARRRVMIMGKAHRPFIDVAPFAMYELPVVRQITRSAGWLNRIAGEVGQ